MRFAMPIGRAKVETNIQAERPAPCAGDVAISAWTVRGFAQAPPREARTRKAAKQCEGAPLYSKAGRELRGSCISLASKQAVERMALDVRTS